MLDVNTFTLSLSNYFKFVKKSREIFKKYTIKYLHTIKQLHLIELLIKFRYNV